MKIISLIQKEVENNCGYPSSIETFAEGINDDGQQVTWKPSKKELEAYSVELEEKLFACRLLLEEEEQKEIHVERVLHDVFD